MNKQLLSIILACLCSLTVSSACAQLKSTTLLVAGQTVTAEVADNDKTRKIGLMHRTSLPVNHGMLFVFDDPRTVCMWMKNTLIPLSVAFIDRSGTVVNIEDMKPQTRDLHCSLDPVLYALEMNQGWFAKHKISAGYKIQLP